jgi:hypothetical protein
VKTVLGEIEVAITVARENNDSNIQAFWKSIPSKGDTPTVEEVIAYIVQLGCESTH